MSNELSTFGLLCIFHVIGGAAIGRNVRMGWRNGWSCNLFSMIVWGAVFGFAPLVVGFSQFSQSAPFLLVGELAVVVLAFLIALLLSDWLRETFDPNIFVPILVGGVFMVIGVVALVTLAATELGSALVLFAGFGGIGGFVLVVSTLRALKS